LIRYYSYVLDQILSGDSTEAVVENVHEFMRKLSEDVRESRLPLEAFIIYKRLGKDPSDYPDAKSQPHVQVALRMKATLERATSFLTSSASPREKQLRPSQLRPTELSTLTTSAEQTLS
jgi:DNA polymerase family B